MRFEMQVCEMAQQHVTMQTRFQNTGALLETIKQTQSAADLVKMERRMPAGASTMSLAVGTTPGTPDIKGSSVLC